MAASEQLTYVVSDRVATITFNRPEKNNAWTPVLERELREAIGEADDDPDVRCIVITGAGSTFCTGADSSSLKSAASTGKPSVAREIVMGDFEQQYSYILACTKPVIAAINGAAAGVGFCLTLYCDIRYISAGTRISTAFARRGLPAEHGSAWLLPRQIGLMAALDLLMSGRAISSTEAAQLGLAYELPAEDFLAKVQEAASVLANRSSPVAISAIKQQIYLGLSQRLAEAIQLGDKLKQSCIASEDFREGVAHFLERRPPQFPGR